MLFGPRMKRHQKEDGRHVTVVAKKEERKDCCFVSHKKKDFVALSSFSNFAMFTSKRVAQSTMPTMLQARELPSEQLAVIHVTIDRATIHDRQSSDPRSTEQRSTIDRATIYDRQSNDLRSVISSVYRDLRFTIGRETTTGFTIDDRRVVIDVCDRCHESRFSTVAQSLWGGP